jgi:mono/diheme cytochrome c family protein
MNNGHGVASSIANRRSDFSNRFPVSVRNPLFTLYLSILCLLAASSPAAELDATVTAFLKQHCTRCHGEKATEGDLRLDQLGADLTDTPTFTRWQAVVARLRAGDMPPTDEPRPPAAEVATVIRRLSAHLDAAAAARRAEGRTTLRRLNRTEYENTVRDLFAVEVTVKNLLPEDTIAFGFDNIGSALSVSPVLIEQYLEAADAVITAALAPVAKGPTTSERHFLKDSIPSYFQGCFYDGDDTYLFRAGSNPTHLGKYRPREGGLYRFKIHTRAHQSEVPLTLAVLAGNFNTAAGSGRRVGYFDVLPEMKEPIEVVVRLAPRETLKVEPAFLPRTYVKPASFREYPGPSIVVSAIEVEGPLPEAWPTESYRRVLGDADPKRGTIDDAKIILGKLLPRAFREPTTEADLAPYLKLVSDALAAGKPFDEAMRFSLKALLCSPRFLYLREPAGKLDDFALASRLSYLLWSSLPDERLFEAARLGELRTPEQLQAQTERMLRDPKAQRFIENFTGQWLSLRDIDFTTPDPQLYPEFDETLKWSMVRETQLFFEELLKHDLSVHNFVDSDFAIINDRLARHYGIPDVTGIQHRRVPLRPEYHRGGVLTHASVLKVTANGTTTSPVLRGVWVLDRIMGQTPKPPPASVPAIEPDIRGAVTIREQLEKHRAISSCAACHADIDPPGFALECFDVIGGYRERYRALGTKEKVRVPESNITKYLARPQYGWGPVVETGDVLKDGRRFSDIAEFKKLLLTDPDQVPRCVTQKLMVYATGSALEYGDHAAIEKIVAEVRSKKYGLRSIVHAVVASELFQTK